MHCFLRLSSLFETREKKKGGEGQSYGILKIHKGRQEGRKGTKTTHILILPHSSNLPITKR